jgi:tetratricopeptide (TPR) repeat protein
VAHAKVRFGLNDVTGAGADAERAVALVRPLGAAAQPSLAAVRGASATLLYSGYVKMRYAEDSAGLALLLEACKLAQSSAAARADPVATTTYASAAGWAQEVLVRQARYDEAERAAGDALAALAGVIAQRPNHIEALDIQARIDALSAIEAVIRKQASRALGWSNRNVERRLALLRLDPLNRRAIYSLSLAYTVQSTAYFNLGRLADAIRAGEQALAPNSKVALTAFQAGNMWGLADSMAQIQAERGEHEAAQRLYAQTRRYAEASASTPYDHTLATLGADITGLVLVLQEGKPIAPAASAALLARAQAALAAAPDKGEAEAAVQTLRLASQLDAEVAYDAGDAVRAEASSRLGLPLPRVLTVDLDLDPWTLRTLHALALARLGRHAEARADAAIAIRAQRAFLAAGADDQRLRFQMAQSLYAAAMAQPGAGQPELKEAAAVIAALPPELRATRTVQRWRGRIEQALKEGVR